MVLQVSETDTERHPPLPRPSVSWALFLDVDGTLIEIANTPGEVSVPAQVLELLQRLRRGLRGALALVSGRSIADLDRLFDPLRLPAAGQHGLEQRSGNGSIVRVDVPIDPLLRARTVVEDLAAHHPGIIVEDKGLSFAVHFRNVPGAESAVRRALHTFADGTSGLFHIQAGKMVLEVKPAGTGKGTVVERFMAAPPFADRTPVFIGDDVTDEDGFAAAQRLGGYGIRIGPRENTAAVFTLPTVSIALDWLAFIADALDADDPDGAA